MVQHTTSIQSSPLCGPPTQMIHNVNTRATISVLYEFNHTLEEEGMGTISVGTFHSWLKQHHPYVGICPLQSDFCDKCKEYQEEIARAHQVASRLQQSGHATEESIHTQEDTMTHYTALLQEYKEEAQSGLEYYRRLRSETECNYRHICILQQQNLTPGKLVELKRIKRTFSAFISADYMMGRNLPHWGESAQPSKMYYMMKLVCDVFGVIDHSSGKRYAYHCGPKSTDHTLSLTTLSSCILTSGCNTLPCALTMLESVKIDTL